MLDPKPTPEPVPYVTPDTPRPALPPARGRRVIFAGVIILAISTLVCLTPLLIDWGSGTPYVIAPALFALALGLALILNGLLDLLGGRR